MYLKIENFRQHESLEVELPDTGLVLISGKSGVGKSTIFDAIEDVWFGEQRNTKPWAGGKPSVSFNFAGMEVTRTRTPNTFSLINSGHEFKDDAAQAEVSRVLGMSYEEFMACSYVRQGFANSLLDLSPGDKMRFIQNLLKKKTDPEVLKEKIRKNVDARSKELESAKFMLDQTEKQKEDLVFCGDGEPKEPEAPVPTEEFAKAKKEPDSIRNRISEIEKEIAGIKIQKEAKELAISNIEKQQREVDGLTKKLEDLPKFWDTKTEHEKKLFRQKLFEKTEFLNNFNKLTVLASRVHEKFPESTNFDGKLSVFIHQLSKTTKESIDSMTENMAVRRAQIQELKTKKEKTFTCPECSAELKIDGESLVKHDTEVENQDELIAKLISEIESISSDRAKLEENLDFLQKTAAESQNLKAKLGNTDPAPEYKDLPAVTKAVEEIEAEMKDNETNKQNFLSAEANLKAEKRSLDNMKLSAEVVVKDDSELKAALPDLQKRLGDSVALCEKINKYEIDYASYLTEKKHYEQYVKDKAELNSKAEAAKDAVKKAETRLAASKRLKERSDFAASSAIESKITEINANSAQYVDEMFHDDGTIIQLSSTTVVGKGKNTKESARIGLDVYHKGQKPKDIKPFSGGEKSRACLCFQLGLSEMYNSPILMIDEGFTGLDDDLKQECLDVLKNASKHKLILVIEHGVPYNDFDEVIRL